jgi:hypothetical protein
LTGEGLLEAECVDFTGLEVGLYPSNIYLALRDKPVY